MTGLPRIEQLLEGRLEKNPCELVQWPGVVKSINDETVTIIEKKTIRDYKLTSGISSLLKKGEPVSVAQPCLLYTSPSPRDATLSRMPSSA